MPDNTTVVVVQEPKKSNGILDWIGAGGLKSVLDKGTEILAALTRCTVRPKGTPHKDVWTRASKFFYMYGENGIVDEKLFKQGSLLFDKVNGRALEMSDVNLVFDIGKRKALEATLRKKCETPTGSIAYYTDIKPISSFRGYIKLSDGRLYDAVFYGFQGGGSYTSPIDLPNKSPIGTYQTPVDQNSNISEQTKGVGNLAGVALLGYLLTK